MRKREKRMLTERDDTVERLGDERLNQLGDQLREAFDDVRDEPIPKSLLDLVEALREAEKKSQTRH
ncbi:MAG: NepR family anti-sigma factor [Pseudomonadota bacterium]